MAWVLNGQMSVCFVYCLVWWMTSVESNVQRYYESCAQIKMMQPDTASGEYKILTKYGRLTRVYCEMGLHGGGYTFLHPEDLSWLTDAEVQHMFTGRISFLMRIRKTDGTQPYAVLSQLSQYSSVPLMIGLSQNTNYYTPLNTPFLLKPYLYFGFLPDNMANRVGAVKGMLVNDFAHTYTNCDGVSCNYIALFPNFRELPPNSRVHGTLATHPYCPTIFAKHQLNPSGRVMPSEYFMFGELHFCGCVCYSHVDRQPGVLSATIGFK